MALKPVPSAPPEPACNFCGKEQHEVRKLVAGPTAHICNECVVLAADLCGIALAEPANQ